MKTIKELTVKMTFRVGLENVEVSDVVFNGLNKIEEQGNFSDDKMNISKDQEMLTAWDWLGRNIDSNDAMDTEYEIEDFIK
ncbi:hypothetical protein [Dysgonomonas macrotermitis]|uniref:Uncharacterized protein n=1 Tax=Dysgonomonas macrotermitis TaxID=1346286 RepID=A0A1M4UM88_9BACT|nr:hypothetical protein [Dysgonomonas macrotermitis]SHE57871.1 hypothetical protein SAMN05444362_101646 [Dysgonomonas macrotermitis]